MRRVRIAAGDVSATAVLNDSRTAEAVWAELPLSQRGNTWGDEIYFGIPVRLGEEDGREVVEMGDLGYWPPGHALCIFFGPTPASLGNEIRPASAVNVFGRVEGDATVFRQVADGAVVTVEKLEDCGTVE